MLFVEVSNQLDLSGRFRESEIIDAYLIKCATTRVKPNWANIGIAGGTLALVAMILTSRIEHSHTSPSDIKPTIQKPIQPEISPVKSTHDQILNSDIEAYKQHFLNNAEGHYSNIATDPGGPTYGGITHQLYDRYRIGKGLHPRNIKKITPQERDEIISKFWNNLHAGGLPFMTAISVVDFDLQGGFSSKVIKAIQQKIGIPIEDCDGVFGTDTVHAIWKYTGHSKQKDLELSHFINKLREHYWKKTGLLEKYPHGYPRRMKLLTEIPYQRI